MTDEAAPLHLVTVWNPSYADDAMDEHLRLLLNWAASYRAGVAEEEDVHVWWAKIRSPNRREPLQHAPDVLAIQDQIRGGVETHVYLTDYRSLYVAHLEEVTDDDVPGAYPDERENMPPYYKDAQVDFWFRLRDLRRLVADDTPAVIAELRKLRNTRYHNRPVSLYGGMVELPLIVASDHGTEWFADREALLEGRLWCEFEAELRGESERMARELRDNLLGTTVWSRLEPTTRSFLTSAEAVYRARRDDPSFDFAGPLVEYCKAVEVELNALLFPALRRHLATRPPADRTVRVQGSPLDLGGRVGHQTLGAMKFLLEKEAIIRKNLEPALGAESRWLLGERTHWLAPLVELRNPGAHSTVLSREDTAAVRERVLGIGHEGLLVRIARTKMRQS